ncbi:MAG: ferritin-like domain-containing protein [Staphylothermus sp.]|nr:ferritin-like domain-containing protein [Staphylothermus sp.]
MNKDKLISLLREMSQKEKEYAKELKELTEKFKHPVLSALIKGIAIDSEKHSMFYESLAELLSETQPFLSEEELEIIKKGIKKHIDLEAEMIEFTHKLIEETQDPREKMILSAIYEDEVKHHKLLLSIQKHIAEKETFTEELLWDAVWKDSPWHGSPGG